MRQALVLPPIAHAATSETDPVKQGLYGIFEVFMDTIVICTLTALTVLCGVEAGVDIAWGQSTGTELIAAAFATIFGNKIGALIVAVGISLFALTTILSWSLYGTRCFEFLFKGKAVGVFQTVTDYYKYVCTAWRIYNCRIALHIIKLARFICNCHSLRHS